MTKREFTLTFEDDKGDEFTYDVLIEWDYCPANYDHPDESYMEVLNLHELPEWITEDMIFDKLDTDDFEPEYEEYDPDRYHD
jgi:hypothetical protein